MEGLGHCATQQRGAVTLAAVSPTPAYALTSAIRSRPQRPTARSWSSGYVQKLTVLCRVDGTEHRWTPELRIHGAELDQPT